MNKDNGILQELVEMGSPLAMLPRTMPYSVPEGYFTQLTNIITGEDIEWDENSFAPGGSKMMPYHVPGGYFEQLTANLVSAATAEGTALPKVAPFTIPAGYFDQLPAQLLNAAKATDTPKAAPVRYNLFRSVQWAAAAIFIMFIGIGAYITFFNQKTDSAEVLLAAVPNTDIHDYIIGDYRLDVDRIAGSDGINNLQLDKKEIIEYLNETGWDAIEL